MITPPLEISLSPSDRFQRVLCSSFLRVFGAPQSRLRPSRFRVGAGLLPLVVPVALPAHSVSARVLEQGVFRCVFVPALAVGFLLIGESFLTGGVLGVVAGRSGEEVVRVYATPVITPMANQHPFGDRPVVEFVGKAVRGQANIPHTELPVTGPVEPRRSPHPAACPKDGVKRAVRSSLFPEPVRERCGRSSHIANITRSRGNL
jgi:hypothetical protein